MKKTLIMVALGIISLSMVLPVTADARMFTAGMNRDHWFFSQYYPAPCIFPPMPSPCAAPCRPPVLQKQAVPCAVKTACPSKKMPCHGFALSVNPYPLFR